MFKFFRTYNKIILVVGGVILMIAFLVPQAAQMFAPTGANARVGYVNGEKIRRGELRQAAGELRLLEQLPLRVGLATDDELAWALLHRDAEDLGLWASASEVNQALGFLGYDETQLADLARQAGTTADGVRHVVRRFLISEKYRRLVEGVAFTDPGEAGARPAGVDRVERVYNALQQVGGDASLYQQIYAPFVDLQNRGALRVSTPVLRQTVRDNRSALTGRLAVLRPDPQSVPEPDAATLREVFDTYRDVLPGEGEPYPFGYRYPDRVRGRYLTVPGDAIRDAVDVQYVDVKEAYNRDPQRFAPRDDDGNPAGDAPERPDASARAALRAELTDERARVLADRIAAFLTGQVAESVRGLTEELGYYELPAGHEPPDLDALAALVREQFGVNATAAGDPDAWAAIEDLAAAPGIGAASPDPQGRVPFAAYVASTRELVDDPEDVPRSFRTQVGLPGQPLRGPDGGVYLHLITAASPDHPPAELDEVRDRVTRDARLIAAYEQLQAETDVITADVRERGVDPVASDREAAVVSLPPFRRVQGLDNQAPRLPEVGVSRRFVDAAFGLVDGLDAGATLDDRPAAERTVVVPLPDADGTPGVAVFVAQTYAPMRADDYATAVAASAPAEVSLLLRDRDEDAPLSAEALARRTGFDLEAYRE